MQPTLLRRQFVPRKDRQIQTVCREHQTRALALLREFANLRVSPNENDDDLCDHDGANLRQWFLAFPLEPQFLPPLLHDLVSLQFAVRARHAPAQSREPRHAQVQERLSSTYQ